MSRKKRMLVWILGGIALMAVTAFIGLRWAIATNGPAVLDTADRITGGGRDVELLHSAQYGQFAAQKLRIYTLSLTADQTTKKPLPVILFQHGGSWNSGDPDDYGFIARALAPEGFIVVLAGYQLHPDAKFPAMLSDTARAIAWTRANITGHGGDPDRIILAGHSAGAYNVVMTALDPQWLANENIPQSAIAGVIGLSGPYDFYPFDSPSTIASFGGSSAPKDTQPINKVRGDAPPMLFIHGKKDTTVRERNSRMLAEAITAAGGSAKAQFFAEMDHAAPLMAFASPYRRDPKVVELVAEFSRKVTAKAQTSVPVQAEIR